jgi:hypothetical protein
MVPDYSRDFVKLPRDVGKLLARDHAMLAVYIVCLIRARYVDGADLQPGRGIVTLRPGELVLGRDEMGAATGLTANQVRGALSRLQTVGLIATQGTNRGTLVSLLGYGDSEDSSLVDSPARAPANHQRTTSGPPADHQRLTTNQKLRRREDETAQKQKAELHASPAPAGWKPPAGGKAEAEASRRIAAGELSPRDRDACWEYLEGQGIASDPPAKQDARAAGAIRKQRPTRAEEDTMGNYEERPW